MAAEEERSRSDADMLGMALDAWRNLEAMEPRLKGKPVIEYLHQQTKLKRVHVGLLLVFFLSGFVFFGYGAKFLVNVIGFAYPAYASFKAIETKADLRDDKQWLTYWVVFAFVNLAETVVFFINWFPFYQALKMGLFLYLQIPSFGGASWVYDNLLAPLLRKHKDEIDATLEHIGEKINDLATPAASKKRGFGELDEAEAIAKDHSA